VVNTIVSFQFFTDLAKILSLVETFLLLPVSVFMLQPKDHKTVKPTLFQALEKELVFDIDMTDYDDVRSCCS